MGVTTLAPRHTGKRTNMNTNELSIEVTASDQVISLASFRSAINYLLAALDCEAPTADVLAAIHEECGIYPDLRNAGV
jgi:hypothetical protein